MIKQISYLLFFLIFQFNDQLFAQYFSITGKVIDNISGEGLSYSNIRILNSTVGTASNSEGFYKLNLKKGHYTIIASYIGYLSDTTEISLFDDGVINFNLSPIEIIMDEITVEPGVNPAYNIIKNAVKTKNEIKGKINNYRYSSYTKGIIKTTKDLAGSEYSLSSQDTGKLKISGILENESRGFFKTPDNVKHFIVARKQTANTPPFINILTGGMFLQSFYEDELQFIRRSIPSPISEEALSYYYFYVEKEIAMDDKKVFQIYFDTDNPAAPGFYGKLFIADSSFHLLKADVNLNSMANPGGLFDYVKIYQQFSIFDDGIALPIDYRLFAEGNYLGLAKFGFELNTILNSYEINSDIDEELFDNAVISVLPDADKKDENYWGSIQSIPNTMEEEIAYNRIDSLTNLSKSFGQDFSFLSDKLELNNNIAITGPLGLYSFNKIEGSTLNLGLYYNDGEEQRLNLKGSVSYGFADDLVKKELQIDYLLGEYRTSKIEFSIYDKVNGLFGSTDNYNKFTSTVLSLFTKYDFRNYYYSKGLQINISSEITPLFTIGLGYISKKDISAENNSDFSFFYNNRSYSENMPIYDSMTNAITASLTVDFRKFIEDGFFRRRITERNNIIFNGSLIHSNPNFLNSGTDFTSYKLDSYGSLSTFGNWSLDFSVNHIFSWGTLPIQWLYALPGNISAGGKDNSFRTLRIGEVYGDKVTTVFLKHNFLDDIFKFLQIPFIESLQLQLSSHLNIAMSEISQNSKMILNTDFREFREPFYELGFGIGHILIPLNFEFTWKLNYRGKNNFVFGINSFAL